MRKFLCGVVVLDSEVMLILRILPLVLVLTFSNLHGAFAFTDTGPGFLPPDSPATENTSTPSLSNEEGQLAKRNRILKDWQAGYENFKISRSLEMQCAALVKIADIQYQMGNLKQAEKLYQEAYDATEKDILSLADKAVSHHDVSMSALNSYACFLAESGQIAEASRIMRTIYKLLKQPTSYSYNFGFGGNDDFGTFLAIVKKKNPKAYSEFFPLWKAYKATVVPSFVPKITGFKIDVPYIEQMSDFVEDKAIARDQLTCRYGYVNKAGKWEIEPKFIAANPFSNGVATAKIPSGILPVDVQGGDDYFSLIDTHGKELVQLPACSVTPFMGQYCFAQHHSRGPLFHVFDRKGEILYSGKFRNPLLTSSGLTIFEVTGQTRSGCIVSEVGHNVTLELKPDSARAGHFKLIPVEVGPQSQIN